MDTIEKDALEKARTNEIIRSACSGHLFERIGHYGRHRCRHCHATADAGFVEGYLQGLSHSPGIAATHGRTTWVRTVRRGQ